MPAGGQSPVWRERLQTGRSDLTLRRPLATLGIGMLGLLLAGCNRMPDIVVERIPKDKVSPPAVAAKATTETPAQPQRTLAAMVLAEEAGRAYFLKLGGDPEALDPYRDEFLAFVRSFETGSSPDWTLPDGWKERPEKGMRIATIIIPADPPLEVAITPLNLPEENVQAYRLANVNRWRRQLGLKPIEASQITDQPSEEAHTFQVALEGGGQATVVDITGVSQGGMRAPFAGSGTMSAPAQSSSPSGGEGGSNLSYELPSGWEKSRGSLISAAAFAVDDAEITITALSAEINDLLRNVNRWRGQIGMEPTTQDKLQDQVKTITLGDGKEATYVVLSDSQGEAILGVIAERGRKAWFIKMVGSEATITEQKPRFEAFVHSLRFEAEGR